MIVPVNTFPKSLKIYEQGLIVENNDNAKIVEISRVKKQKVLPSHIERVAVNITFDQL